MQDVRIEVLSFSAINLHFALELTYRNLDKIKHYFSQMFHIFCLLTLYEKFALSIKTNEPFGTTTTPYDGSNIEMYFDGYSHNNCVNADYLGDVVSIDYGGWVRKSKDINVFLKFDFIYIKYTFQFSYF